jgi:hypothetical protein
VLAAILKRFGGITMNWQDFFKKHGDSSLQYFYYFERGADSVKVEELYQAIKARLIFESPPFYSITTSTTSNEIPREVVSPQIEFTPTDFSKDEMFEKAQVYYKTPKSTNIEE